MDFGAFILKDGTGGHCGTLRQKEAEAFERKKGELLEDIAAIQSEITNLKEKRKNTKKHIELKELPENERMQRLSVHSKHFIDTIKIIAYRAETALAHALREKLARNDDARSLLRAIFAGDADLLPDEVNKTITVRLHHLANPCSAEALRFLCDELNQTETIFPGSDFRIIYDLVS